MVETAAHLVEHVLPEQPIRQWVLSFPYPLRFLFATRPAVLSQVLGIVYRAIATFLVRGAGLRVGAGARTGAVITLIQRFRTRRRPRLSSPRLGGMEETKAPHSQRIPQFVEDSDVGSRTFESEPSASEDSPIIAVISQQPFQVRQKVLEYVRSEGMFGQVPFECSSVGGSAIQRGELSSYICPQTPCFS